MITDAQVVLAIFVLSFALILSEVVHRTIAAWFGSVLMLLYGHATGVFHLHMVYDSAGDLDNTYSLEHTMLGWIERGWIDQISSAIVDHVEVKDAGSMTVEKHQNGAKPGSDCTMHHLRQNQGER
jgi:hypothetical protein